MKDIFVRFICAEESGCGRTYSIPPMLLPSRKASWPCGAQRAAYVPNGFLFPMQYTAVNQRPMSPMKMVGFQLALGPPPPPPVWSVSRPDVPVTRNTLQGKSITPNYVDFRLKTRGTHELEQARTNVKYRSMQLATAAEIVFPALWKDWGPYTAQGHGQAVECTLMYNYYSQNKYLLQMFFLKVPPPPRSRK